MRYAGEMAIKLLHHSDYLDSHMTKRGQSLQNSDWSFAATEDSKSYAHSEYYPVLFILFIVFSDAMIL